MMTIVRLAGLLRPYWKYLIIALLATLGDTAAGLLQPWPLKLVFDNVLHATQHLPPALAHLVDALFGSSHLGILYLALALLVASAVLSGLSTFTESFIMARIANWVLYDLRRRLYWHVQHLSLSYHNERRVGDLMSTVTGDVQLVLDLIAEGVLDFVINVLMLVGMTVVMFAINWRFALLALSIAPFLFVVVYRFTRRSKKASRSVRKQEGRISSMAQEVLSSMRVVQAYTREDYEQQRFEDENQRRVVSGIQVSTLKATLAPLVELLVAVGTALVMWYGAHEVLVGRLTPGALLVFLAYLSRLYGPMRNLSKFSDVMFRASVGLERIYGVLEAEREVRDLPGARPAGPLRGHIEFEHVSFAYGTGAPTLKDITFSIEPGQVVALVGSTGAGKTTLASLIPRFADPAHGSVRVDGCDVRSYTLASLRSQIALVLQETILFYGTVRDNIAYGRADDRAGRQLGGAGGAGHGPPDGGPHRAGHRPPALDHQQGRPDPGAGAW